MDEKQRVIYEKVRKDISIEIIKDGRLQIDEFNFVAVRLLRLIQVSSYPAIYDESYDAEAPKLKALKQIINLIDPKEKIIIWTNFVKTSNCILKELTSYGAVLINGEQEVRKEIKLLSGLKKIQR